MWGHLGIVHVTEVVPYPVLFINSHVTHLHRQVVLEGRLPGPLFVNIPGNPECVRHFISIG